MVPGGRARSSVWAMELICASAISGLTLGWKNTLMTATPLYDCDSMCSMSLTVVVMARSVTVTMRFSMSSGVSPVYDHTRLITGILMLGKMSLGVVMTAATPKIAISTDTTTNVYGRRSAKRTIHMTTQPSESHRGSGVIGTINEAFPVVPVFGANATILNFGQRIGISLLAGSATIAIQISFLLLRVQPQQSFSSNPQMIGALEYGPDMWRRAALPHHKINQ